MKIHETWNTCPKCLIKWQTIPAIPGLVHKSQLCDKCKK